MPRFLTIFAIALLSLFLLAPGASAQRGGGFGGHGGFYGGGYRGGGFHGAAVRGGYRGGAYRGGYYNRGYGYGLYLGYGYPYGSYGAPYYAGDYYDVPSYVAPAAPIYVAPPAVITPSSYSVANPGPGAGPTQDLAAHVTVQVPTDAEVWFGQGKTRQTGGVREFVSPALTPGQDYTYVVKARWMEGGKEVVQSRSIDVLAGSRATIDFMKPAPEAVEAPKPAKP